MAELQFRCDRKIELEYPVAFLCAHRAHHDQAGKGECLIYGRDKDGNIQNCKVSGSQEGLELPFESPTIYVTDLGGVEHVDVVALGHVDKGLARGE